MSHEKKLKPCKSCVTTTGRLSCSKTLGSSRSICGIEELDSSSVNRLPIMRGNRKLEMSGGDRENLADDVKAIAKRIASEVLHRSLLETEYHAQEQCIDGPRRRSSRRQRKSNRRISSMKTSDLERDDREYSDNEIVKDKSQDCSVVGNNPTAINVHLPNIAESRDLTSSFASG